MDSKKFLSKTIKENIKFEGIGIHTGKRCNVVLKPSLNHGIIFKLLRNNKEIILNLCPENVISTKNQIVLGNSKANIMLVEHLLSALNGLGITNCIIESNSPEIPGMDGSAFPFVEKILNTGIIELGYEYEYLELPYPIWVIDGDRHFIMIPSDKLSINCMISYPYPSIGKQSFYSVIDQDDQDVYVNDISKARTFGFIEDHNNLKSKGVCLGSSFKNTLAFTKDKVLSDVRYQDEAVRHKVLDIIGDIYLLNRPIKAHIITNKSGHSLDYKAVAKFNQALKQIKSHEPTKEEINEQYKKFELVSQKLNTNKL